MSDRACAHRGCHRSGFWDFARPVRAGTLIVGYCDEHHPDRIEHRAQEARTVRVVEALRNAVPDIITDQRDRERAIQLLDGLLP